MAQRSAQFGLFVSERFHQDQRGCSGPARQSQHRASGGCVRGVREGRQVDPTAGGDHETAREQDHHLHRDQAQGRRPHGRHAKRRVALALHPRRQEASRARMGPRRYAPHTISLLSLCCCW